MENNKSLQDYCQNNYPRCFEPICEFTYYPDAKEIDEEVKELYHAQLKQSIKIY